MTFRETVYEIVHSIPPGQVATYGQIAALAGYPNRARHVGHALADCADAGLPWHRVVNSQGKISLSGPARQNLQAERLRAEGVCVREGRVRLREAQWQPSLLAFAAI